MWQRGNFIPFSTFFDEQQDVFAFPLHSSFHCSFCDNSLYQPTYCTVHELTSFISHRMDSWRYSTDEFRCEQCDKTFSTKKILNRHIRELHISKLIGGEIPCDKCGKTFSRQSNLIRHIAAVHSESDQQKNYKHCCHVCGAKFKQKCHLNEHSLIHIGVRHICSHCGHSFSRAQSLKLHISTHHTHKGNNIDGDLSSTTNRSKDHCKKIAYMNHDDHIDFLLTCGSILCNSVERVLPDGFLGDGNSHTDGEVADKSTKEKEIIERTEGRNSVPDQLKFDVSEHFRRARVVKHGDHFDIALDGYLWNKLEGDTVGSTQTYVNHGTFPITEIDDGVEGFLEFLSTDLDSNSNCSRKAQKLACTAPHRHV